MRGAQVLLLDENHPIRGSWGSTRASHLRMEDPVLLHMGIFSIRRLEIGRFFFFVRGPNKNGFQMISGSKSCGGASKTLPEKGGLKKTHATGGGGGKRKSDMGRVSCFEGTPKPPWLLL